MWNWPHPLKIFVQTFLSSDSILSPETLKQLYYLEAVFFLTCIGLILLALFFRKWRRVPTEKLIYIIWTLIFIIAILVRVSSANRGFQTMELFDSVHYTVPAQELIESGSLTLPLNETEHPNSKAPGFSLLISPIYLFTKNLGAAVFSPFIMGILSLIVIYFLTKSLWNKSAALLAFLLLAFSPLHILYSKLIMPSIAPLFLILCAVIMMVKAKSEKYLLIAGLLFGFAAITRYLTFMAIPAAFIYLLLQTNDNTASRWKRIIIMLLGAATPIIGMFYYNWQNYGSPLVTGYSYWTYFSPNIQKPFALEYAFGIPPISGGSPNALFALVSATGVYIPYPNILMSRPDQLFIALIIWIFAIIGLVRIYKKRRPFFYFAIVFVFSYYLFHAFLFTQTAHFMLPVVPFMVIPAAVGVIFILQKLSRKIKFLLSGILTVFLLSFLPFAYSFTHQPFENDKKDFLILAENNLPNNAYFISDYEPILFTHQVGREKHITYIAVSPRVTYADRRLYLKGEALPPPLTSAIENVDMIKRLIKEEKDVFMMEYDEKNYSDAYKKVANEFNLVPVAEYKNFELYKLTEN